MDRVHRRSSSCRAALRHRPAPQRRGEEPRRDRQGPRRAGAGGPPAPRDRGVEAGRRSAIRERGPQAVADDVHEHAQDRQERTRDVEEPWPAGDGGLTGADQQPERGVGDGEPEAEERQHRLGDDRQGHREGGVDRHRRADVRQHVAEEDPPGGEPHRPGRLHVVTGELPDGQPSHDAGEAAAN